MVGVSAVLRPRASRQSLGTEGLEAGDAPSLAANDLWNHCTESAAQSGAATPSIDLHSIANDRDLQRVVEAWPRLPLATRQAIVALLNG
jgi:hypothetical protein